VAFDRGVDSRRRSVGISISFNSVRAGLQRVGDRATWRGTRDQVVRERAPMASISDAAAKAASNDAHFRRFIGMPARQPLFIVTATLRISFPSGTMVTD
jgi:hypothetical protein